MEVFFELGDTSEELSLDINVSDCEVALDAQDYIKGVDSGELYQGDYVITPLPYTSQQLPTKDKTLIENVTVEEIPIAETSNNAGGITLYIGG